MDRRTFLQMLAAAPLALDGKPLALPQYRVVSPYAAAKRLGMPGPYPGKVVSARSGKCIDESNGKVDATVVREMMARGMCELTGRSQALEAWKSFFEPGDVVGIKVNCGGRPDVVSSPEIVAEIVRNLMALGLKPEQIVLYERFQSQLDEVNYGPHLPKGIEIVAAEKGRGENHRYDPAAYVEVDFFGEEDTRSNLMKLVTQRVTKIINVPNVKDHGAAGVTGCLKNIAYGSFSNVARSHREIGRGNPEILRNPEAGKSHTYSFVATLAAVEPLRSRTVLQIMDGLRGVWHGGPFVTDPRFRFYPKQMLFGTDPVAIDRLLLDMIDSKRKAEGAISIWDRSRSSLGPSQRRNHDPNVNILIREPGHVEYASTLGLGVHDLKKIQVKEIEL
ncbi:MAG: DUF362 domain-containing protein [Acidobacteria bacterium]|nr:DUF362 domain-containing protein [Acidobacteriota bacterium]